jgi:hypothetical protein
MLHICLTSSLRFFQCEDVGKSEHSQSVTSLALRVYQINSREETIVSKDLSVAISIFGNYSPIQWIVSVNQSPRNFVFPQTLSPL